MNSKPTIKSIIEELEIGRTTFHKYIHLGMPNPKEGATMEDARNWIETRNALSSDSPHVMANGLRFTKEQIMDLKGSLLLEQTNRTKLQAKLDEIKIQIETKELVPSIELEQALRMVLQPLRQMLVNLPQTLAHKVNPTNPKFAKEVIEKEIQNILENVQKLKSNYVD